MSLYLVLLCLIILFYITRLKTVFLFSLLFLFALLWHGGTFIVNEGTEVVITQFGRIIGKPYVDAGLYFKIPLIWKANYFDKRIFTEEFLQGNIATKDGYLISVDTIINWRIGDATLFFQNMHDLATARQRLRNIVSGSVREVVAKYALIETVRSSNIAINLYNPDLHLTRSPKMEIGVHKHVQFGRAKLSKMMKDQNYQYTLKYGMNIVNVLITNIQYGPLVEKSIKDRMIIEQITKAQELRSVGQNHYQQILGETQRKYQSIVAPAKMRAEIIKGDADGKATQIYAKAFGSNPGFYNFWRTLTAYEMGIPPKSQGAILSTQNNFLKLLNGVRTQNGTVGNTNKAAPHE